MFDATRVGIRQLEGEVLRSVSPAGPGTIAYPEVGQAPLSTSPPLRECVVENRQLHFEDFAVSRFSWTPAGEIVRAMGIRTSAGTPLSREGKAIGVMVINRNEVRPFTPAGLVMRWRGDGAGLYLLPLGILLAFVAVGINAWVLLVEINR